MVFVLFEVKVKEEGVNAYLALAAGLKGELERAEGFITWSINVLNQAA